MSYIENFSKNENASLSYINILRNNTNTSNNILYKNYSNNKNKNKSKNIPENCKIKYKNILLSNTINDNKVSNQSNTKNTVDQKKDSFNKNEEVISFTQEKNFADINENPNNTFINEKEDSLINDKSINFYSEFTRGSSLLSNENYKEEKSDASIKSKNNNLNENKISLSKISKNSSCYSTDFINQPQESNEMINKKKSSSSYLNILNNENCNDYMAHSEYNQSNKNINLAFDKKKKTNEIVKNENNEEEKSKINALNYFFNTHLASDKKKIDDFSLNPNENMNINLMQNKKQNYDDVNKEDNYDKLNEKKQSDNLNYSTNMLNFHSENNKKNNMNQNKNFANIFYHENIEDLTDITKNNEFSIFNIDDNAEDDSTKKQTILSNKDMYLNKISDDLCINKFNTMCGRENNNTSVEKSPNNNENYDIYNDERKRNIVNNINNYIMSITDVNYMNNFINMTNGTSINNINNINGTNCCTDNKKIYNKIELKLSEDNKDLNKYMNHDYNFVHHINNDKDINCNIVKEEKKTYSSLKNKQINLNDKSDISINCNNISSYNTYITDTTKDDFYASQIGSIKKINSPIIDNNSNKHNDVKNINNDINNFDYNNSNRSDYFSNKEKSSKDFESIHHDLDKKYIENDKYNYIFKKCMSNIIKNDNFNNIMIEINNDKNINEINNINHIYETQNVHNENNVKDVDIIRDACKNSIDKEINCINNKKYINNLNNVNETNPTNDFSYIKDDNNINDIKNVDNIKNNLNGISALNELDSVNDIGCINNVNSNFINDITCIENGNTINNMNDNYMKEVSLIDKISKINDKNSNEINNNIKYCDTKNILSMNINNKSNNCIDFYNKNLYHDLECENGDMNMNKNITKENEIFNNKKWLKFFSERTNKTYFEEIVNGNESFSKNTENDKKKNCLNFSNNENMKLPNCCNNDNFLNNWNDNMKDIKINEKKEFIIKDINNENLLSLNLKNDIINEVEPQNENKDLKNNDTKTDSNTSFDICEEKIFLKKEKDKTNDFNEMNFVNFPLDKKEKLSQINEVKNLIDNINNKTNNEKMLKKENIYNSNFNIHINGNIKNNENVSGEKMESLYKWLSEKNISERDLYFKEGYSLQDHEMEFKKMSKETLNKNPNDHLGNIIKFKCDINKYSVDKNVEMKKVNEYFYNINNNNNQNSNYNNDNNNCVDNDNKNINNTCSSNKVNNSKNVCNIDMNNFGGSNNNIDIYKNSDNKNNNINNNVYSDINNIDNNNNNVSSDDNSDKEEMENNSEIHDIQNNRYSTTKKHNENEQVNFSTNKNFNNIKKFYKNIHTNKNSIINNRYNYYYDNLNNINICYDESTYYIEKTNQCNIEGSIGDFPTSYDKLKEMNPLYCNVNVEKINMNTNINTDFIENEENDEKKIKTKDISYLRNNYKWSYLELNYPKNINFKKAFFFSYKNDIYIFGAKQNNFIIPDKIFKINKNEIETIRTKGVQPQIYLKIYFLYDVGDNSLWDFKLTNNYTNDNLYKYNNDEEREDKNKYDNNLINLIHKNKYFLFSDQHNYNKDNNLCSNLIEGIDNEYDKEKKYFYILGCKEQRTVDFYTIYKLDMNNFQWEEIKITYNRLLNLSREDFSIILINNCLYLFGGVILSNDKWNCCNEFWKCNIKKRKWKLLKLNKKKKKEDDLYYNFNTPYSLKYLINLKKINEDQIDSNNQIENENKDIMKNGNENNSSSPNDNKNFIEKWPTSRACHLCAFYNNKIFIHGGTNLIEEKGDFYFFDLKKKKWYEILCNSQDYPSNRYGHSGFFIKNKLYIYGGYTKYMNYGVLKNDFFEYDFEENKWKQIFTIDDLLYLKIDLIKKKKSYIKFLQLLILKNYYKSQLVNSFNLSNDQYDKSTIDNDINFKENISNNDNSNNHKTKLNTYIIDDTKINDEAKKSECIKIMNEKETYEKNSFESYLPNNGILIKYNYNPFFQEIASKTSFNNSFLFSDYFCANNLYASKEFDIFFKNNKIQRNLYCNFLCIEESELWKKIIIPYNNFRNNCLYFNNSLYFFGGCGLDNNTQENTYNSFIYYDNILKIQINKSYIDFILHYLFYVDNFFFEFIENLKNNILKDIRIGKKNEIQHVDERSKISCDYKTNATYKKNDVNIGNCELKKDQNTYEVYMNIKIIDDELHNTYMNIYEKGDYNEKNERNSCENQIVEQNYTEDKNISKLENQKLGNIFLSVQKKKMYELLTFLFDLYENIYSKNMIPERYHDQNEKINIHSKNDLYDDLYEKTYIEQNDLNYNISHGMFTKKNVEIKINDDKLSEEVEKNKSLLFQTSKSEDQEKNIFQGNREYEIDNYNKNENSFKNIYDISGIQYSNEIKKYQNENKSYNILEKDAFNNIESNNKNVNSIMNDNNVSNNLNYEEIRSENYNESFNVISNENYKTNYNEVNNENYNDNYDINGYYNENYNNNYNQDFNKSYYENNGDVLYTNHLPLNESSITNNNIIIKNYENINLNDNINEINNFKEYEHFSSSEMENIYNSNIYSNMNKTNVYGYNKKNFNYNEENINKNNFTSYCNSSNIESRRMHNEQRNCEDFYNCYESNENNFIIQKYFNNNQINLNIDKSIIYNYLENFHELNDEKYAIKMKIKRNDIYKLIYTYTKNVEIENSIYFRKIEKLEAQVKDLLEEKNSLDKSNKMKETENTEYPFNEVHFDKLKNEVTYLKKKLNHFYDIINIYSIKLQKQNLYIKIIENKYEYLMNYLLKLKSVLYKESISNDICKFFYEDNFFIHEKNNAYTENSKNVTFNNSKIRDSSNFNEVDYISHI
ncbi:conserved Plasmodium protein, unknown function [Plasmodium relictum]|uniref:Kelch domain-containing protein n=1 Tax=Plasmodium relictum TaxID=85471 RepID=A0A1J1H607_PLARL|nr:conserved Plasmodium protein, unknown function [Plasmodium relictum]CRH00187.1 conserved Plasmodium protein, unknown function [Plasmodium relictum]